MDVSRRKLSYIYYLTNGDGVDVRVCLRSFIDTFSLSKKRAAVARTGDGPRPTTETIIRPTPEGSNDEVSADEQSQPLQSNVSMILPHSNKRGKHGNNVKKLTDNQTDFVFNHIKMFPRYVSHSSRKKILLKALLEVYHL